VVPEEEFSDSDDEGMGDRRHEHSYASPAALLAATAPRAGPASARGTSGSTDGEATGAGSGDEKVPSRSGKVVLSGAEGLLTDLSGGGVSAGGADIKMEVDP